MKRLSSFAALLALLSMGCGASQTGPREDSDRLNPARLYPLHLDNVWSYDIDTGTGDPPVLGITRVVAARDPLFEVSANRSDPVVYEVRPEGIYKPGSGTWLLRAPIRVGSEWPTTSGMTARVESITESVETPAGNFENCVRVEESGGEVRRRIRTVYCTDVGPVLVRSAMQAQLTGMTANVTALLRGHSLAPTN